MNLNIKVDYKTEIMHMYNQYSTGKTVLSRFVKSFCPHFVFQIFFVMIWRINFKPSVYSSFIMMPFE